MKNSFNLIRLLLISLALVQFGFAQQITSPKEHFGFNIGDDYQLASFTQTEDYFKKLDQQSDRLKYTVIGKTEEGRDQCMLIVSSPENLQNLEEYKKISTSLARAEMSEEEARSLSQKGKSIVWIDGGLHSTEVVGMHQLIQIAYLLASSNDAETKKILDNTIVLLVHANPDGQELVTNWYMREKTPEKRSSNFVPVLYQKYAGHDNNRDFFMLNLKETQNMARQLFVEWVPQIMYNHHQTAPAGAVVAGAPYRDPFNYVFDPLLMSGIDALGAAMANRLNVENKPGYTAKDGSVFSTWYNGGLRTTTYFHNIMGLLTEMIGNPTPFEIPLVPNRLIPNNDTQNPVLPQVWHFQQSIDYSTSLNYAILNYASRYKDEVLYNIYKMGRNSIERGSKDFWALSPSRVAVIDTALQQAKRKDPKIESNRAEERKLLGSLFNDKDLRDPRGYIIPSDQPDFVKATDFINALIQNGIEIKQASNDFTVNGKKYAKDSYIIKTDQAFRPHILDMFEAQDHPDDFQYPGGPPIPPYDAAGWTLAYLMDVKFDRVLDDFNGPFQNLEIGKMIQLPEVAKSKGKFLKLPSTINESFRISNDLLKQGKNVWRDESNGDIYVENKADVKLNFATATSNNLPKKSKKLKPMRIALWDTYGGSMPSGWLRFLLEQYHYNFDVVYAPDIDKGNLNAKYDIIIFPGNSIPRFGSSQSAGGYYGRMPAEAPENIPSPYKERWGRTSVEKTIPVLKSFLENGGKVLTIGSSSDLAEHLEIGVENHLVDANKAELKRTDFYTPGSVLTAKVGKDSHSTWGYEDEIDVYYSNDNLYKITNPEIKPILWFDSEKVLKSGWSWGQKYLKDGVLAFEAPVGKGTLVSFGNDINFRAQTHGTFKLLFNQLM
ncbi:M14 family metallopeptidase [Sphingobacterium daejeonense]|uniref:M14 family metallopeptidase n=1 Tax=Sphingobacterium daejeonense TaxID=371142 RepID=UPI0021A57651|nr:M14 metallopeptidase family protein [Sphingobacterium daejeonense]MCT1532369.1 M14 family metallopeptidase [Sphingobacterium daejeonense]